MPVDAAQPPVNSDSHYVTHFGPKYGRPKHVPGAIGTNYYPAGDRITFDRTTLHIPN